MSNHTLFLVLKGKLQNDLPAHETSTSIASDLKVSWPALCCTMQLRPAILRQCHVMLELKDDTEANALNYSARV